MFIPSLRFILKFLWANILSESFSGDIFNKLDADRRIDLILIDRKSLFFSSRSIQVTRSCKEILLRKFSACEFLNGCFYLIKWLFWTNRSFFDFFKALLLNISVFQDLNFVSFSSIFNHAQAGIFINF